jgi:WD40 repeat protein
VKHAFALVVFTLVVSSRAMNAVEPSAAAALCAASASQGASAADAAAVSAEPYWLFFRTERHPGAGWSRLADDDSLAFIVPADHLRPPQDPKLVICIDEKQREVGSYKAAAGATKTRSNAYQLDWKVSIVRLADRKVVSSKLLSGGPPPKELDAPYPTVGYGTDPRAAFRDWMLSFRTEFKLVRSPGAIQGVSVSPDGSRIAVAFTPNGGAEPQERGVDILEVPSGAKAARLVHTANVDDVAFSPDGSLLASAASDGVIHLWDFGTRTLARSFPGQFGSAGIVRFSPDGKLIASAGSNGSAHLWEVGGEREVASVSHGCAISDLTFSPRSDVFATSGCGRVKVWETKTQRELRVLDHVHSADPGATAPEINAVAFTDGGQLLLSAGSGYGGTAGKEAMAQLRVWNAASGEPLRTLNGRSRGSYVRLALLPDRKLAAADGGDIDVWNLDTGRIVRQVGGHSGRIRGLEGVPGGQIVSGGLDGYVSFWTLGPGHPTQ